MILIIGQPILGRDTLLKSYLSLNPANPDSDNALWHFFYQIDVVTSK